MAQKPKPDTDTTPATADDADAAQATAAPAPDVQTAAKKRAAAKKIDDPRMVDSLLAERRGYVQRGNTARVAQVDEQIRFYGGTPPTGD